MGVLQQFPENTIVAIRLPAPIPALSKILEAEDEYARLEKKQAYLNDSTIDGWMLIVAE